MEMREEDRKEVVLSKIAENEKKVEKTKSQVQAERVKKAEEATMKREDRVETVNRIAKMQEYNKEQLLERIEQDNEKTRKVQMEKQALLEARSQLRKDIEKQKHKVLEEFERMKKSGKFDVLVFDYCYSQRNLKSLELLLIDPMIVQEVILLTVEGILEGNHLVTIRTRLHKIVLLKRNHLVLLNPMLIKVVAIDYF
jgi:hypothetical protein